MRTWQSGAEVLLHYAVPGISLLELWSATRSSGGGSGGGSEISVALGDTPDMEHHGFGFSARGADGAKEGPMVSCKVDVAALMLIPVPSAACGMGASHSVVPNKRGGPGSFLVRIRLSQWQMGASVTIVFAESVETLSATGEGDDAPAAVEFSEALGAEPSPPPTEGLAEGRASPP